VENLLSANLLVLIRLNHWNCPILKTGGILRTHLGRLTLLATCSSNRLLRVRAFIALFTCVFLATAATPAAASSIKVDPQTGIDIPGCGAASPCRSIAYAVQRVDRSAPSSISLAAGFFNDSTVNISGMASFIISGVPSATVFDCSSRLQPPGAAFLISNSSVVITGVTFQTCHHPISNGGAISATASSVTVSHCSFTNCSAASGGAIYAAGPRDAIFLLVRDSVFSGNSAIGGLIGCPDDETMPCSSWGGGVAAAEVFNVSISGCRMLANTALAFVPKASRQYSVLTLSALAGGGCVSVLFSANASGSKVHVADNEFDGCEVDVSAVDSDVTGNVAVGNGMTAFTFIRV
jgi:hypothetical protein